MLGVGKARFGQKFLMSDRRIVKNSIGEKEIFGPVLPLKPIDQDIRVEEEVFSH